MIAQVLDTPRQTPELRKTAGYLPDQHGDSMESVAEISIKLPDKLVEQLQASGHRNVSAFIANLIRDELDRERLIAFLDELDEEFGPTDETEVAECSAAFMRTVAITRAMKKQGEAE